METVIPFDGFYDSWWSSEIDMEQEQLAENIYEREGVSSSDVFNLIVDCTDYSKLHEKVAIAYVAAFREYLKYTRDINVELRYNTTVSPREYNFTTDRIFVEVSKADMHRVYNSIPYEEIVDMAKKMFTSRDGFSSFYDPDVETWGPVDTWDHNQLSVLFRAITEEDDEFNMSINEYMCSAVYDALDGSIDWDKLNAEITRVKNEPLPSTPDTNQHECKDGTDAGQHH